MKFKVEKEAVRRKEADCGVEEAPVKGIPSQP
jgi:hypothetical protein